MMELRNGFIFGLVAVVCALSVALDSATAITTEDLVLASQYDIVASELPLGNENVRGVELQTAVHLYDGVYSFIYINTNGILTFGAGHPEFLNQPLPIEYPAIVPFYTNIDTTDADPSVTSISYFESSDPRLMRHLEAHLYGAFPGDAEFEAAGAFVVTWTNVGHFNANHDKLNTFQVVIVSSSDRTYVLFQYPKKGLNWIQADIGDSGLVDVRAQAGFVSEDGRYFKLPGSGTDNSKYLDVLSNHGNDGSWWFLVGPIAYPNEIIQPHSSDDDDHQLAQNRRPVKQTCATHGLRCHVTALCVDNAIGFCCKCRDGYYGNGFTCLRADAPIRVSGRIAGSLGTSETDKFATQLQAYVSLVDGQTFAAITPLEPSIGQRLQLLQVLAGPIGWLFALPTEGAPNGYQLTGGKFNHTATIRFHGVDRQVRVEQRYVGLNAWDQLEVEIDVSGELPDVAAGSRIVYPDIVEQYAYSADSALRSIGTGAVQLNDDRLTYSVVQQIVFERCEFADEPLDRVAFQHRPTVYNKVFRVTAAYSAAENALRIGSFNKITLNRDSSACNDGTATCGENTVCVPAENDAYDCICKNGFLPSSQDQQSCGDIDECADQTHICDANALCSNSPGGYECRCAEGFVGNGYKCFALPGIPLTFNESVAPESRDESHDDQAGAQRNRYDDVNDNDNVVDDIDEHHSAHSVAVADPAATAELCDQCSPHADCHGGTCECRQGYFGDGVACDSACDEYSVWSYDRCVPIDQTAQPATSTEDIDEEEVAPFCHSQGCTCPTGYLLDESADERICRREHEEANRLDADNLIQDEDKLPCDVENDCNPNASCEFIESVLRHKCVCKEGFVGDGHDCAEQQVSCTIENNCHELAECLYDVGLGISVCRCSNGYDGDGHQCEPAPECRTDERCGDNAVCVAGTCQCNSGYEKGHQVDLCVLAGACGGAYCAENANCEWDAVEQIAYCECAPGYHGNGVRECVYVPPPCNVLNNCGLNAVCAPDYRDPSVYQCVCNGGFNGDGFVCTPEENCHNTPSLCDPNARCISAPSGLHCACNTGFVGNGSHCAEPPRFDSEFLLLSRGLSTIRVPLDGKGPSRPIFMSHLIMGLDNDCSHGRVYWSDLNARCIMSATYDGRDKKPFITENIRSPEGVAVDWISRRLYWTDSEKDTVEVASLDDPTVRSVIVRSNLVNPRGIAVDPHNSKIYWSDWNRVDPKIEWANLDGSEREVLLSQPHVLTPNHVAISPRTRELCFVDAGTKKLECIDSYRKQAYTVAANLSYPFGLAITESQFYWTDWISQRIETVDHDDKRLPPITIPIFSNHRMYGLTAVSDDCPLFYSPCQVSNGGCSADRICLVNQRAPGGRTCKCSETATDCSDDEEQ